MSRSGLIVCTALILSACSRSGDGEARPAAGGAARTSGGRPPQTLTLAPTDIDTARRIRLFDGVPVTGPLRPIETVDVRARIEGDIDAVYAREGEYVRAGQLLARFESVEQQSASQSAFADRAAAQSELSTAEWNLEQTRGLFKAGAVPERDVRNSQQAVAAARARVAATQSRVRSTGSVTRDTRVLAPTSGTIEKRTVERGEHMARGAPMFTLVRNDVLELAAAVPEKRANAIQAGQRVDFEANGQRFEGRVARVSPTIDPATRSITVYVQVPNARGTLKGGTFASGSVVARQISNALVVPVGAIRLAVGGKVQVYRIASNAVDPVHVETGVRDDRAGLVEVVSGLREGDAVISGNVGTVGKGMKVEILRPRENVSR